jgi:hypothetical protein
MPADSVRRLERSRARAGAPPPARRPLLPPPAAGRGRPARPGGTTPPSRAERERLSERDTHSCAFRGLLGPVVRNLFETGRFCR